MQVNSDLFKDPCSYVTFYSTEFLEKRKRLGRDVEGDGHVQVHYPGIFLEETRKTTMPVGIAATYRFSQTVRPLTRTFIRL